MTSIFDRFAPRLRHAVVARLGWTSLRPVQELAGQALLDGDNAVVLAPTAGGKTEAAFFPLLSDLVERRDEGALGLIYIAPIKALLNNQAERLATLTEMVGLRRFLWHGDVAAARKRAFVGEPADVLMTTPESLEVMLLSSRFPEARLFADLRSIVVDEVHALAGTDRGAHLMSVLERIARYSRHDIQRVGLSATVGNPEEILAWLTGTSKRRGRVVDPPKEPTPKDLRVILRSTVGGIASQAARRGLGKKSLFFCQSRALTESVAERMRDRGIDVFVHHSSVSAEERRDAEARFHHGRNACIVCTSTLELGIDVGDLDLVFQADAPSTVASFLQRLGRTGRRDGSRANMTFFCEHPEAVLQAIALVELARRGWVEPVPLGGVREEDTVFPPLKSPRGDTVRVRRRSWPVLVHQLLALALQHDAVRRDEAWDVLSAVPDFAGISREEFDELVDHLLREGFLWTGTGENAGLAIGDRTERIFGRHNFMELYAVFSSPRLYRVVSAAGQEIGHLEQGFVDKLVETMSAFLLAGRGWAVERIVHRDRRVVVVPAPRGRKPSWGGFLPRLLGFELCREMARVLADAGEIPYADEKARAALTEMREDLGSLLRGPGLPVRFEVEGSRLMWWNFAGGQINHALRHGLLLLEPEWTVVADNRFLRVEGAATTAGHLEKHVAVLGDESFWSSSETEERLLAALPEYRLSKFQRALPRRYALEMIRDEMLDIAGAVEVCARAS